MLRVAADGNTVLSPARRPQSDRRERRPDSARRASPACIRDLSERETENLGCLGEGLSNSQIAGRLHLTEATVKAYVSRTLTKLDCTNRTQAA